MTVSASSRKSSLTGEMVMVLLAEPVGMTTLVVMAA